MNEPATPTKLKPVFTPADYQRRFHEARLAAGWSLKSVGEALGKTLQYVSQFEQGRNEMTVGQFLKACEALNLRTDWVLHGEGKMFQGAPPTPTRAGGRKAIRSLLPPGAGGA